MSRSKLLDAVSLEDELMSEISSKLDYAISMFPVQESSFLRYFDRFRPEIEFLLKSSFSVASLKVIGATVGQRALGVELGVRSAMYLSTHEGLSRDVISLVELVAPPHRLLRYRDDAPRLRDPQS